MYPKIDNPMEYKVAFYLRLSKEDYKTDDREDDDSQSIKNQRELLESFAREQKLLNYTVYADDGYSGTMSDRPSLQRMFEDIRQKKINLVITKDLSRLSRNHIDSGEFLESFFPQYNVRYIALTDSFDTATDGYTCEIAMFKSMFNDLYAKDISRKITSIKRNKQKQGLFIGGKAPYGYKTLPTDKNHLVIDENVVDNVIRIFKLAADGVSCRQIAVTLNEEKIPSPAKYAKLKPSSSEKKIPYSGLWSSERIAEMLKNEVYIGSMVQGRVQKLSYKNKKCHKLPRDKWIVVENTHEPIVDRETFEKVGLLIESRKHTRSRTYDYLLKGLIVCHECGYPLGVQHRVLSGNREALYFVCRTYQRFTKEHICTCHCIREEYVNKAVIEQVRNVCRQFLDKIDLSQLTDKANDMIKEERKRQEKDVSDLKNKLKFMAMKIERIYEDRLSGLIDEDLFQRMYRKFTEEQATLKAKISALENSDEEQIAMTMEKIKELVTKFLNADEYSREMLVSLIERVELTENKEILIYFRFKELNT
jgi:DNA invertase Pin-like site-specific DNA recombinase